MLFLPLIRRTAGRPDPFDIGTPEPADPAMPGASARSYAGTVRLPPLGIGKLSVRLRDTLAVAVPKAARLVTRTGSRTEARLRPVRATSGSGHIALVGAGPGARDLLTLRAVRRLQEADVIFYDRLVEEEVLELAPPEAERIFVGKEIGANAWPQERICRLIVAEALKGRRVVRLKSGDPSIFGRANEEIDAARAHGIDVEIVPGVTAACASAAARLGSLTERGEIDSVVFLTGTCRDGDAPPDWAIHARPGTTLVIYMGIRMAARISEALLTAGADPATPVQITVDATRVTERLLTARLGCLSSVLTSERVRGGAILTIRFPKRQHRAMAIAAE